MPALRLFVALEPPDDVRAALARAQDAMRRALGAAARDVKWVDPANVHVTVQFLGAVEEARAPEVEAAVRAAAGSSPALALRVSGCGAFPSARRPRVLWAGLAGDVDAAAALARALGAGLGPLGFPPEARAWSPHLTLGRARDPRGSSRLAPGAEAPVDPVAWDARELVLFRSHLSPKGPRYEPLARAPLGSPGP